MALNDIKVPKENASGTFDETVIRASDSAGTALGTAAAGTSTDFSRADHVHAMPTANDVGALSNTADLNDLADAESARINLGLGTAATLNVGTTAGTVAAGDDARLSDARTPTSHVHSGADITSGTLDIARVPTGTGSTQVALGNHTHELTALAATGATNGHVLTANGSGGVTFAAASGGGVTTVGTSTADVFSVSGSDLVADDGGTIDSSDPFIKWDDAAGKLVYANPLRRNGSGAFYVGLAPTTTALGTNAIYIGNARANENEVPSNTNGIVIGQNSRAAGSDSVIIGPNCSGTNTGAGVVVVGSSSSSNNTEAVVVGRNSTANARFNISIGANNTASGATGAVTIGSSTSASGESSVAIGRITTASGSFAYSLGNNLTANLRAQFATTPFSAVYWSGQTTNNTATILNLDGTATNRFTIAASTALAVDILLVARRSDTQNKWLVARRFLGIRRDGSNNTSLIGSVETLGTDQSAGSPSWTFALTADDTNEALQLEVTGAASETVQWRATAFYRVA